MKAAIAGASGYVGGELIRLLHAHPQVQVGALAGHSSAASQLGRHHAHVPDLADEIIQPLVPETFVGHDIVFLALPHGHSARLAAELPEETLVLDCGADFRIRDADQWLKYYGGEYAGHWPYGLPEMPGVRAELRQARRIAVPGCYPTAATLAMMPALGQGLVQPDVVVVAASGTSGAGRDPKSHLLGSEVIGAMSAYGVGGVHRHIPEIRQNLGAVAGRDVTVSFTPTLAPMTRGILLTASAPLAVDVREAATRVRTVYDDAYREERFVELLPEGVWPTTAATLGSNAARLQVTVDVDAHRLVAVVALDNLTKGAAGQAVQAMNIALGLPEDSGLSRSGVAP